MAEIAAATTLFAAAEGLGFSVPSSCHQQGKCRECLMEVVAGHEALSAPAEAESHLKDGFRLSCRTRVLADAGEVRCHMLRRAAMQVEEGAVNLPPGDTERGWDPAVTRDGDRVLLDGEEIARSNGPLHGVAIDVGTTTVVVRAINLETGCTVATASFENPQRFGGTDVMARIQYDTEHAGRLLQRTLLGYLSRTLMQLPVDPRTIYEFVVVGNSTMCDLFFGLDGRSIGQKPYWSQTEHEFRGNRRAATTLQVAARELRLPSHPRGRVYAPPVAGGHVGADAAAVLLAIAPHRSEWLVAIMDIGTNTELFMGNRHNLLAASCPAGSAFEGRGIHCGMPGLRRCDRACGH